MQSRIIEKILKKLTLRRSPEKITAQWSKDYSQGSYRYSTGYYHTVNKTVLKNLQYLVLWPIFTLVTINGPYRLWFVLSVSSLVTILLRSFSIMLLYALTAHLCMARNMLEKSKDVLPID